VKIEEDALRAYQVHLQKYAINRSTYEFHVEHIKGLIPLAKGDHDYLAAQLATGPERDKLIASATESYQKAKQQAQYMLVRYHIDDQLVPELFPPGITRMTSEKLDPKDYASILEKNKQLMRRPGVFDQYAEDRVEYERYEKRAETRLQQLAKK
jgi:hypothetical protein